MISDASAVHSRVASSGYLLNFCSNTKSNGGPFLCSPAVVWISQAITWVTYLHKVANINNESNFGAIEKGLTPKQKR